MKRILLIGLVFALLASACSVAAPALPEPVSTQQPAGGKGLPADIPPAQAAAIQALADLLGIPVEAVQLVRIENVEWLDHCLGIVRIDALCMQGNVPGYRIILEADGLQYAYHTNQDGTQVELAPLALTWHREGGLAGFCDTLYLTAPDSVHTVSCGAQEQVVDGYLRTVMSDADVAKFENWMGSFGTVKLTVADEAAADGMSQELVLYGSGSAQPGEEERQEMLQFAERLYTQVRQ